MSNPSRSIPSIHIQLFLQHIGRFVEQLRFHQMPYGRIVLDHSFMYHRPNYPTLHSYPMNPEVKTILFRITSRRSVALSGSRPGTEWTYSLFASMLPMPSALIVPWWASRPYVFIESGIGQLNVICTPYFKSSTREQTSQRQPRSGFPPHASTLAWVTRVVTVHDTPHISDNNVFGAIKIT